MGEREGVAGKGEEGKWGNAAVVTVRMVREKREYGYHTMAGLHDLLKESSMTMMWSRRKGESGRDNMGQHCWGCGYF